MVAPSVGARCTFGIGNGHSAAPRTHRKGIANTYLSRVPSLWRPIPAVSQLKDVMNSTTPRTLNLPLIGLWVASVAIVVLGVVLMLSSNAAQVTLYTEQSADTGAFLSCAVERDRRRPPHRGRRARPRHLAGHAGAHRRGRPSSRASRCSRSTSSTTLDDEDDLEVLDAERAPRRCRTRRRPPRPRPSAEAAPAAEAAPVAEAAPRRVGAGRRDRAEPAKAPEAPTEK